LILLDIRQGPSVRGITLQAQTCALCSRPRSYRVPPRSAPPAARWYLHGTPMPKIDFDVLQHLCCSRRSSCSQRKAVPTPDRSCRRHLEVVRTIDRARWRQDRLDVRPQRRMLFGAVSRRLSVSLWLLVPPPSRSCGPARQGSAIIRIGRSAMPTRMIDCRRFAHVDANCLPPFVRCVRCAAPGRSCPRAATSVRDRVRCLSPPACRTGTRYSPSVTLLAVRARQGQRVAAPPIRIVCAGPARSGQRKKKKRKRKT